MTHKILLVDDAPDILRLAAGSLRKLGYEVVTAGSAAEALRRTRTELPDAVMFVNGLPEKAGFSDLARLDKATGIPFVKGKMGRHATMWRRQS